MRRFTLLLTAVLVTSAIPAAVFAQDGESTPTPRAAAKAIARCGMIERSIENKIDRFDSHKRIHARQYQAVKDQLTSLVTRAKAAGYDTAKVEEDLRLLEEKVDLFVADYTAYITALRATQQYTCGKSEGDFRDSLRTVRTLLQKVHADAKDIRQFVTTVVKPDIRALKAQIPSAPPA